ncbi:tRNAHis-5'-guanylyltransferase [Myxococcus hansupus]|uniref:tRNA(His) guanylyltransferase n=1 Tax=Pseudomyxococcus hansupus TaxID=1297742 RepID=A0A0H4X867_9BACT|nr:tRNA(His) guanylyltransferase Thg1 family protein [Myxococcus hansupus]AKQ64022.1 tRNAHis-5'-guanylyltransferase [Myxococcus hansupus]
MDPEELAVRARQGEAFHNQRMLPGAWGVLRVDGRGFSRFTEARYEKPFDPAFHQFMVRTATALLEELQGVYAYTQSDEISVLFRPDWSLFDRSVEKVVSLGAGLASATFTHAAGVPAVFDGRVWLGASERAVLDYFLWRQADGSRCALHGWCYWTLRKEGRSAAQATRELDGKPVSDKNELLFQRGINFNEVPLWQRRGSAMWWEPYVKEGVDPRDGRPTRAQRWRLEVDSELPMKEAYENLLRGLLTASGPAST